MPYVLKQIASLSTKTPAFKAVLKALNTDMKTAQKLIDKARIYENDRLVKQKSELVKGDIFCISYENKQKGLKPVYENEDFAVYDKPSGVLTHPNGRNCEYSLCDELWSAYGKEACVAHRLDKGTSGLLLVGKSLKTTKELKELFAKKEVQKSYLCFVRGHLKGPVYVNKGLLKDEFISVKMRVARKGELKSAKKSSSFFTPLKTYKNSTLVKCVPFTGRQHQLRVHLASINHPILGDMLYGVSSKIAAAYLDKELEFGCELAFSGAKRLLLHANFLSFKYKNRKFAVKSISEKTDFLKLIEI